MADEKQWLALKSRVDDMNDVLAEELSLDPAALRDMPAAEALDRLRERMDAYKISPQDIEGWHQICVGSDDHVGCFRERLERAMDEPPRLSSIVVASALGAGALAFALSYWR